MKARRAGGAAQHPESLLSSRTSSSTIRPPVSAHRSPLVFYFLAETGRNRGAASPEGSLADGP